jgi:hypothetical protein
MSHLSLVPPGHGEGPVGAAPEAETLRQGPGPEGAAQAALDRTFKALGVCPRCFYRHGPDEVCGR